MVVFRIAGTDFAVPVEGETYLVQLFAIAVDIVDGGDCGMLSRLYRILFCRQAGLSSCSAISSALGSWSSLWDNSRAVRR